MSPPPDIGSLLVAAFADHQAGRLAAAAAGYRRVLDLDPKNGDALHNLGVVLATVEGPAAGLPWVRRAVAEHPAFADAHFSLGRLSSRAGDREGAEAAYRRALALRPDMAAAWTNLGNLLDRRDDRDGALACRERAVACGDASPEPWVNLVSTLLGRGDVARGLEICRQVRPRFPDCAELHWGCALTLLTAERWCEGWEAFEWRWRLRHFTTPRRPFDRPRWDGRRVPGGTVLVHAEQGFGDAIQFARFVPAAAARCRRLVLECRPELRRLFATLAGPVDLMTVGEPFPAHDAQIPLMSLPWVLDVDGATLPGPVPYLVAPAALPPAVEIETGAFSVGVVWSARRSAGRGRRRSLEADALAALARVPGVRLYGLRGGEDAAADDGPPGVTGLGPALRDFADTAAVVARLDAVVTVDTAVAHVAGALGRPAWVLLPWAADWRWGRGGARSLWYPSLRLVRQPAPGAWRPVIETVVEAVAAAARGTADPQPSAISAASGRATGRAPA